MRLKLLAISLVSLLAGLAAGIAFLPGARDALMPTKRTWTIGKAAIGGPFRLIDHDGKSVSEATYKGEFLLVFFGFTYCPDICPAALQTVSAAMDKLGAKSKRLRPLFVSVDPERDKPAVLKEYMSNFHPQIRGLTGSPEQVAAAAKAYRVFYRKVVTSKETGDYTMDHSGFLYLMSPDGEFITHFAHNLPVDKLAARIAAQIG